MAILSDGQALALIKAPRHQREIREAQEKRQRHSLHTEARTSLQDYTAAAAVFFAWVKDLLKGPGAYERFVQLARPPFATNKLVNSIFTSFEKVFQGANSFEHFDFTTPELEQDFTEYRKQIGDFSFWRTQGMECFKYSIDNILVVDLPLLQRDDDGNFVQESDRPEPYYFLLDIDRLHDIENDKVVATDGLNGNDFYYFKCEYLIYRSYLPGDVKRYYVLDDVSYRIFDSYQGTEPKLSFVAPHGLDYCPARSFWTEPLNYRTSILKSGPITDELSNLDWLLFFQIAERYLQLYAPFPIYALYKKKCDYKEDAKAIGLRNPRQCIGGYLEYPGQRSLAHERIPCPKCGGEAQIGPGAIILVDPPRDKGDDPDLMNSPVKVVPAETQSLEYIQKRIAELKQEITINCIGRSRDTNDASAKNELQVESGFESSEDILNRTKINFEIIHSFALDTIARLRYGDQYLGGTINYGDEFFTRDETQEIADYKAAKDQELPTFDLAERRRDIARARYRNNPKMLRRMEILENLEPFPDMSIGELSDFKKANGSLVSDEDFLIKARFVELVNRFEREQGDINQYGSKIDFDRKINLIKDEFTKYAAEYIAKLAKPVDDPALPGGPGAPPNPGPPDPARPGGPAPPVRFPEPAEA